MTTTENCALVVELVEAREGDRMLVRIADRTDDEIYGTALDVEPYLIEAPVLEVFDAAELAQKILRLTCGGPWRILRPEGREIYYEGDDPQKFAEEIRTEFGFDVCADEGWGVHIPGDDNCDSFYSYGFHCPPGILDAIYGGDRWPMGS